MIIKESTIERSAEVIGYEGNSNTQLCTYDGINLLSKYKPTDYARPVADNRDLQVRGGRYLTDAYNQGWAGYGIVKPYMIIPAAKITNDWVVPDGTFQIDRIMPLLYNLWTKDSAATAAKRLGDFRGYIHKNIAYPATNMSTPYNISSSAYEPEANTLAPSSTMYYSFDDFAHDGAVQLGLRSLFGMDRPYDELYYGLIGFVPNKNVRFRDTILNPNKDVSQAFIARGSRLGQIDPLTGRSDITTIMAGEVQTKRIESGKLVTYAAKDEWVLLIPVIMKALKSSPNEVVTSYYAMPLAFGNLECDRYQIKAEGSHQEVTYISRLRVKFSGIKRSDGTVVFYIANADDMTINLGGVVLPAGNTLRQSSAHKVSIMPGDGTTYVQNIIDAHFGNYDDKTESYFITTNLRVLNATAMYGNGSPWSSTQNPDQRPISLVVRPSQNTFKLSFSFPYLKNLQIPKYFLGTFDVDISSWQTGTIYDAGTVVFTDTQS